MSLDPRAAAFGGAAECYERGRPGYPPGAIAGLVEELAVTRASVVLDLAAGTGKLTRALLPHPGEVIAVEPVADMRRELAARLAGVTVLAGEAEAIPLADGCVDAVFVGEAFHWFDTERAAAEIARVLTPRGGLALLWNVPTWSADDLPWLRSFGETLAPYRRAAGGYPAGDGEWERRLDATRRFEATAHRAYVHTQSLSVEDFVAQVASWSWIAALPEAQRAAALADARDLVGEETPIVIPYRTDVHWTRRRRAAPSNAGVQRAAPRHTS